MSDTYTKMRKQRDRKAYKLGGGAWFRKSDRFQVYVDVVFYPRTKLYINKDNERREVTLSELERDYECLRV